MRSRVGSCAADTSELDSYQRAENWQRQLVKFLVTHIPCVYNPKFGLRYQCIIFLHLFLRKASCDEVLIVSVNCNNF